MRSLFARSARTVCSSQPVRCFANEPAFRPRRSCMYVPGSSEKMLQKSLSLQADSIIMDLEDAVSYNQKDNARQQVVKALQARQGVETKQESLVRINPRGSGLEERDIEAILEQDALPDGIVLPKVDHPSHLSWLDASIKKLAGDRADHMIVIGMIESPISVLRIEDICVASKRLRALIFGGDDYAAAMGASRTPDNHELNYARNMMLLHTAAQNLQAIDIVKINFKDEAGLEAECMQAQQWGFAGKQVIHPSQLGTVNRCFAPDEARIAWAVRVVDAFEAHSESGLGAFTLDDQMIDHPTLLQAHNLLKYARAVGLA